MVKVYNELNRNRSQDEAKFREKLVNNLETHKPLLIQRKKIIKD